jgi:uncharacterized membrane protein YjgN (DUF898 family)
VREGGSPSCRVNKVGGSLLLSGEADQRRLTMDITKNSSKEISFRFTGKGIDLFLLTIKNTLLMLVTLGLYKQWAKVAVQKFYYENTEICGVTPEYHTTGRERMRGFGKAFTLLLVVLLLLMVIQFSIQMILESLNYGESAEAIASAIHLALIVTGAVAVIPLIRYGKRRFFLGRSSWRNVRFSFRGSQGEIYKKYIGGTLGSVATLGILLPWRSFMLTEYDIENSYFGNTKFEFDGELGEYYRIQLLGFLLTVVTLGLYGPVWKASVHNYVWSHTSLGATRMQGKMDGVDCFVTTIGSLLLVVCTLGLAFPYAMIMNKRLQLESIGFEQLPELSVIEGGGEVRSDAIYDGMEDVGEMLDFVGDFV